MGRLRTRPGAGVGVNDAAVVPTLRTASSTELARWSDLGEYSVMATLTIDLEDDLARLGVSTAIKGDA